MTLLTFTGLRNGPRIQVVWHDGTLSGDGEDAVDRGSAHSASAHSKVSFALRPSPSVTVMACSPRYWAPILCQRRCKVVVLLVVHVRYFVEHLTPQFS